ncbi:helicase [Betaproteobacteria bacterium]|nr:helicase [Betaproteobacteria bacterium]
MVVEKFGKTWWGEHWLRSLLNVDFDNRLPRGASYARGGKVKKVDINDKHITAKVQGSRPSPYEVKIVVPPFSVKQREQLMKEIFARPAVISKLLNRELDPEILTIAEHLGLKVFPRQWTDFQMYCSCPDWAVPCKHLASVIYILCREIDNNPFLVFKLHQLDLLEELNKRGLVADDHAKTEIPFFPDFLTTAKTAETSWDESLAYERLDSSGLENIAQALIRLLPDEPPFYPNGNFREKYSIQFARIGKEAGRLLAGRLSPNEVYPPGRTAPGGLNKRSRLSLIVDGDNHLQIAGDEHPIQNLAQLIPALFALNPDHLRDYHPSVAACHKILFAALHLLEAGAMITQIVQLAGKKFMIRPLPAIMDERTRTLVDKLSALLPPDLLQTKKIIRKKEQLQALENQTGLLLSHFLGELASRLANRPTKAGSDFYEDFFFHGQTHAFAGVGEAALPGGIKVWLGRYHLDASDYKLSLTIAESVDEEFELGLGVSDRSSPENTPEPLAKILKEKRYEKQRFRILQGVSLLTPFIAGLDRHINQGATEPIRFTLDEFAPFLLDILPAARLLTIDILLPKSLRHLVKPKASVRLKKKSDGLSFLNLDDMFDFEWQVALGDKFVSQEDFAKLLRSASRLFKFKEQYFYLDEGDLEKLHKTLSSDKPLSPNELLQAALAEEYDGAPVTLTTEVRALIKELTKNEEIPLPGGLAATLRPYQERGYAWMVRNSRIGFGSLIADDMGLGKTLQVIALLLKLKEAGMMDAQKRALIVVPTGLLANWQAEIARFAPTLSSAVFHGAARSLKEFEADILLTTYGTLRSDAAPLKKLAWKVMVIDEAQNIKNHDTAQAKAVKSIPADIRIAMSGTPVENRLSEFWSIMDFTNKGYLGSAKAFKEDYAAPIQIDGDALVVEKFKKITAPFMMRRMKSDKSIISDLPDKIEQNQYATLTKQQAALYEKTLNAAMEEIEGSEGDRQGLFKRQGLILQMILALKQICNHPTQFLKNGQFNPALSGKVELLFDLLESIGESGEKALIFTQFTEMGDLLGRFIEERFGEKPLFYHGGSSVKKREEMVKRFQQGRADRFFILSLKAGGTGLNLTAASQVIHYDLWWNPAVENQATDRAYRIGQQKNVMVHRMICKNTFEERIDAMIRQKKHLAEMTVASGENWIGKLSNSELREIFR